MHWLAPDSSARALHERARSVLAPLQPTPAAVPWIAAARGAWLRDVDGERCLDLAANDGTLLHGHAHPLINAAVADQLERGCCTGLPGEAEVALAELLCGRVPSFERIRLCASEDAALRCLRDILRSLSDRNEILHVDNDPALGSEPVCRAIDDAGPGLGAVLVDPAPPRHGFCIRDVDDLAAIERCARGRGALVVLDERRAFRLGFAGAQGRFGASPDLTLLGAQIGGGWTTSALAGLEQHMVLPAAADRAVHPDPLSMAAGHASLTLLDLTAFERLDALGAELRARIAGILEASALPLTVSGVGSAFALRDVRQVRGELEDEGAPLIDSLYRVMLSRGVLLNPDGTGYLTTTIGAAELDHCIDALERSVDEIATSDSGA